ncbi:hypothetical protein P9112_004865 [Eukaryota sp. TZLM1-RC]
MTLPELKDDYGFPLTPDQHQFYQQYSSYDTQLKRKWDKFLTKHSSPDDYFKGAYRRNCSTLKSLCRQGIPMEYRKPVYLRITGALSRQLSNKTYYQNLCTKNHLRRSTASDQIDLDLDRTFPEHESFQTDVYRVRLRRVLTSFAYKDRDIGYVQSLNYLVGMLLLVMEEEQAFWVLVAVIEDYLPREYFSSNLLSVMTDQRVLSSLCQSKLGSEFMDHLANCGCPLDLITTDWFMCLFTKTLTSHCVFRIWDAFFYEGSKIIFRFALAILKLSKQRILEATDIVKISAIINSFSTFVYDPNVLSKVAFNKIGSFPMRVVSELRHSHRGSVRNDLLKSQQMREKMKKKACPVPPQPMVS